MLKLKESQGKSLREIEIGDRLGPENSGSRNNNYHVEVTDEF